MKDALGDKVEKVSVSNRIVDAPCVVVTGGELFPSFYIVMMLTMLLLSLWMEREYGTYNEKSSEYRTFLAVSTHISPC